MLSLSAGIPQLSVCLRCLFILAEEADSDVIGDILRCSFATCQRIVSQIGRESPLITRYSCRVLRICCEKLCVARITCGFEDEEDEMVSQFVRSWATTCLQWMTHCTTLDDVIHNLGAMLEVIQSLNLLLDAFPEHCESLFARAMECSANILCIIREPYLTERDYQMGGDMDFSAGGYTSDGDRVDLETAAINLLELLRVGLSDTDSRHAVCSAPDTISSVIRLTTEFMMLTARQQEAFVSDGNEYFASESDPSLSASLRITGTELLREVCSVPWAGVYSVMFSLAAARLTELQGQGLSSSNTVLQIESVLWSLGVVGKCFVPHAVRVKRSIARAGGEGDSGDVDVDVEESDRDRKRMERASAVLQLCDLSQIKSFIWQVTGAFTLPSAPPILQGRAVHLCGIYADILDTEATYSLLTTCLNILTASLSTSVPVAVALQACVTIGQISPRVITTATRNEASDQFCQQAVRVILPLMHQTNENTLHFVADTLSRLLSLNPAMLDDGHSAGDVSLRSALVSSGITVWKKCSFDSMCIDSLCRLLRISLTTGSNSDNIVVSHVLPFAQSVLLSGLEGQEQVIIPMSSTDPLIDVLTAVSVTSLRGRDSSRSGLWVGQEVLRLLTHSAASSRRSHMRRKCFTAISATLSTLTPVEALFSSADVAISCANAWLDLALAALTAPESDDASGTECVGSAVGLIVHVILMYSNFVSEERLMQAFSTVIALIATTSNAYTRHSCTMAAIHLFAREPTRVATMLGRLSIDPSVCENPLKCMLDQWCALHTALTSNYCLKISSFGLTNLVSMFSTSVANQPISDHVLRLLIDSLPEALQGTGNGEDEEGGERDGERDRDRESTVDEDGEEGDDGRTVDEEGEIEDFSDELEDAEEGAVSGGFCSAEDPFAPAELYFSDEKQSGDPGYYPTGGVEFVHVSDQLVFNPCRRDPLLTCDLQSHVTQCLAGIVAANGGKNNP